MVEAMNWISEVVRPKIKTLFKRETPENLWVKCPETGQMVFHKEVEANGWVIPGSEHHLRITAQQRLKLMFDEGKWVDVPLPDAPADPLKFRDEKRYADRLKDARAKTGMTDAFKVGFGLAVLLFQLLFLGRHPFSGVFGGRGEMTVVRAVSECRFAYAGRRDMGRSRVCTCRAVRGGR